MGQAKIKAVDEKKETISLTKKLMGWNRKPLKIVYEDDDGSKHTEDMDVRHAVLMALRFGSAMAEQEKKLSEPEKIRCHILGIKVGDERNKGCSFKSGDISLIKRLANYRLMAEQYCALLEILAPQDLEE